MLSRHKFSLLYQCRLSSSTTKVVVKNSLRAPAYKPEFVEKNKYNEWEKSGIFTADNASDKPTFSIVLPPPNVTGKLHLGHALACTVQDVIVRRNRSLGQNVLWLPGTDHAGIATQGVVEKYLKSTHNISRHEIGREKFNEHVWKWKDKHGDAICDQLRTIGCSLDWSRAMFTMDPNHSKAVNTAFITLFNKGLIYRKKALVNWCCDLKSTVSDIEVDNIAIDVPTEMNLKGYKKPVKFGMLYNFSYKIEDSNEEIVVSTTMPETMLGDTAVAVHPNDNRYAHLKGKRVVHPFTNKTLPIIFDDFVNMEFGTGAVKITPAHSKVDYKVAKHHHLSLLQVINESGVMENAGEYNGMMRYECREKLVQRLNDIGLLKRVTPHQMTLPVCSRTGGVIDHLPKEQWFLSCTKMNEVAADSVRSRKLKIVPEKFVKNWLNWTEDDRDWCISRQLWWGHQIPAYKCTYDKDVVWIAASDNVEAKDVAANYLRTLPEEVETERDTDVLDTWFSSGIYPFSSLGWPENTKDLEKFYPLSLMATGHDILGFWVHRMVILGHELTGKLPFDKVLLHGIICDSKGSKMSKSKGNVIDPIDVINGITLKELANKSKYMNKAGVISSDELKKALAYHKSNFSNMNGIPECGVDALRFTILSRDVKAHYVHFDVDLCHANKLFCNKIWQSVKYTQLSFDKLKETKEEITRKDLTFFDKWILSRLSNMVETVNTSLDDYDFHIATKAIKSLIYSEFCDFYVEATKPGFDDVTTGYAHAHTLSAVLNTSLRCLAPFMIYLTEEIIPKIPAFETNIIHNFNDGNNKYFDFPKTEDFKTWRDEKLETQVENIINTIALVRQLKGFYGISNKLRPSILIKTKDNILLSNIQTHKTVVLNLTKCSDVKSDAENVQYVTAGLNNDTTIGVEVIGDNVEELIDSAKKKLEKKISKAQEAISKAESRLSSDGYMNSVSEYTLSLDNEKLMLKREELRQMQRMICE